MGILGVMGGMNALPQKVKDVVYANGAGVYINDVETGFDPYIKLNYPTAQSYDDIAALFASNAEDQIAANGGNVSTSAYTVTLQNAAGPQSVIIQNYDFEAGDLSHWNADITDPSYAQAQSSTEAHSGQYRGYIKVDQTVTEGKLYVELDNLEPGATYQVDAYLMCDKGQTARLYVENHGSDYIHTDVVSKDDYWVHKTMEFTMGSTNTTARVGLHLPDHGDGDSYGCIDNLFVQKIATPTYQRYEAEDASTFGGEVRQDAMASDGEYIGGMDEPEDYVTFNINTAQTGEYYLRINYANGYDYMASHKAVINGSEKATIFYPTTGTFEHFSRNMVDVPVELVSGNNTVKLEKGKNYAEIDYIDVIFIKPSTVESAVETPDFEAGSNLVLNFGFESDGETQTPSHWGTWAGSQGTDADADYVEANGYDGSYRLTHYKDVDYEVYTSQTITGIENGHYILKAQVLNGGGQQKCYLDAKGYGGPDQKHQLLEWGYDDENWSEIELTGIRVTNNTIQIGLYSKGEGGSWCSIDNVCLIKEKEIDYMQNGDFEQDGNAVETPACWSTWPGANGTDDDADFVEADGFNSDYRLTHYKDANYEVYTDQTISLPNGTYTVNAWVVAGGNHHQLYLDAKDYGGSAKTCNIPKQGWPNWTCVEITGIQVTNGSLTVGLYSNANAGDWCSVDKIEIIRD